MKRVRKGRFLERKVQFRRMKLVDQGSVKMFTADIGEPVHKSCISCLTNKESIEQYLSLLSQAIPGHRQESAPLSGKLQLQTLLSLLLFFSYLWTERRRRTISRLERETNHIPREIYGKRNDDWSGVMMTRILATSAKLCTLLIWFNTNSATQTF